MIRIAVILASLVLLAGCGGSGGDSRSKPVADYSQYWQQGGLIGVVQPTGDKSTWVCDQAPCGYFILHQGHDCFNDCTPSDGIDDSLEPRAEQLAAAGFVVYKFQMPPFPHTGPSERFYQPVLDLINTLPNDLPIFMAGLSGGGWTTTVSTAMTPRIERAYSISGDAPWNPSAERCAEISHLQNPEFELCNPPFPWMQLYSMAGVRLLHIYNFNEGGTYSGHTEPLGYAYVNDTVATAHYMSEHAANCIIIDIRNYLNHRATVSELSPSGQEFSDMLVTE